MVEEKLYRCKLFYKYMPLCIWKMGFYFGFLLMSMKLKVNFMVNYPILKAVLSRICIEKRLFLYFIKKIHMGKEKLG